ncbi:MAG: hypothetical protein V4526_01475 [Patescibacteria group bacterium]
MYNRGYTLLFAILITSIILSVGVSILSIARKEVLLSSGAKESQAAIYMADNGLECALYWEGQNAFSTSSGAYPPLTVTCDGTNHAITASREGGSDEKWVTEFPIVSRSLTGVERRCALVKVTKEAVGGYVQTSVTSLGYNVGGRLGSGTEPNKQEFCDQINLKRVERALQFTYQ